MAKPTAQALNTFLSSVERRAYRMAQIATGDNDVAFDIVQDAMMKLVEKYAGRSTEQWAPLFYRILQNRINDHHRRQSSRWKIFDRWFGLQDDTDMDQFNARDSSQPDAIMAATGSIAALEAAVGKLSPRQQQAFMLRCWEGLDTTQTADAMNCSNSTVKTLYARALKQLREQLGEHYGS